MNINELISAFQTSAIKGNESLTEAGLQNLKAVLEQQKYLRIFFSRASGFGHQANTLTILKRFIELGRTGDIQVIYDADTSESPTTIQKLAILIPGLNPSDPQPISLDGVTLAFYPYTDGEVVSGLDDALLCVNGGAELYKNLTKDFNVKYYLQLQPFRWEKGKNLLWCSGNSVAVQLTDVESLGGKQLLERAFYAEVKPLTDGDWTNLKLVPNIDKRMLERAQVIVDAAVNKNPRSINLVPIYGLPTGTPWQRQAVTGTAECILFSLISAIGLAHNYGLQGGPTVIAVMTNLHNEGEFWDRMVNLFEGVDEKVDLENLDFLEKKEYYAKAWAQEYGLKGGKRVIFFSGAPGKSLEMKIKSADTNAIIITSLSPAPQLLFNYIYSLSTLPCVFEGQGTANLMLNLGKPYWQMAKSDVNPYPTKLLNVDSGDKITSTLATNVYYLQNGIYSFKDSLKTPEALEQLSSLLLESINPDSPVSQYYANLGAFYHHDANDKLLMTALYLLNNYETGDRSSVLAAVADNSLEAFYKTLLANDNDGTLNLIPGALARGILRDYLVGIIGDPKLFIGNAENRVVIDFPDPKNKITVTGKTSAFAGVDLTLHLEFTLNDKQKINTTASLHLGNIEFPAVPWFSLKNTMVTVTVPGNGDRITGKTDLQIDFGSTEVYFEIDFPADNDVVLVKGSFGAKPPRIEDIFRVLGGINFVQSFPPPINIASDLGLKRFQLGYDYKNKKIQSFNVNLETKKPWPLFGKLTLDKLEILVNVVDPTGQRSVSWTASSSFKIEPGQLDVGVTYPDLTVTALMQESSAPIPVGNFLTFFLSSDVTLALAANVSSFSMEVKPGKAGASTTYIVQVSLDTEAWDITLNNVTFGIANLGINVSDGGGGATGIVSGSTVLFKGDPKLELLFFLSASYLGKGKGWLFKGKQSGNPIKVKKILEKYVSPNWAKKVPEIEVSDLYFNLQTPAGDGSSTVPADSSKAIAKAYEVGGSVKVWDTPLGNNFETTISAKFGYNDGSSTVGLAVRRFNDADFPKLLTNNDLLLGVAEEPKKQGCYGEISADIQWNGIKLTVFYDFNPNYKSYGIIWGKLSGKITDKDGKKVATLQFTESVTIGSMVETMVGWATGSKFSLSSPWDILNSIPLNNLSLTYNFTRKQVGLDVSIGPVELGFAKITNFSLTYKSKQKDPGDDGVKVEIKGEFRWRHDPNESLCWDASKPETTPAPSGHGNKYLDLRLLALGQHVTLPCFAGANTVQEAIACIKKLPEPDKDNIMIPPVTLDANSSWLIGMDFGILRFGGDKKQNGGGRGGGDGEATALINMEKSEAAGSGYFITMQIVFNDPNLYALRIKLDGDAAKVLKGLDFEILYKKITDSLGVYKAEITLPDRMRYIRMGTYNITLPVFGIEYFTNGDFQVDIGFPWKENFSRSLTFQTIIITPVGIPIPVTGSLGVYFGKLSSATTNKVPKTTAGTFNPVLVFGFGIQFGFGYSFDAGILKAGFSLTAVAILQGVVARFNPYKIIGHSDSTDQIDSTYYYWLQGTFGIIGKLFGTIDFVIIKASVNIDIRILASVTMAPYEPIELNLTASVDASVSVSINLGLFSIRISFSFSAKISQSVTIKANDGTPPWHAIRQGQTALFLTQRRKRKRALHDGRMPIIEFASKTAPNWKNLAAATTLQTLKGYMALGLTMAGDNTTTLSEQRACYVAMMFIDSVKSSHKDRTGGMEKAYGAGSDTSFELLAKMILRWAVAALQPAPVTAEEVDQIVVKDIELQGLLETLNGVSVPIAATDIEAFMAGQFDFKVEGPTTEKAPDATYFPVAPSMRLDLPKYGDHYEALSYTFGEYNKSSSEYSKFLRDYFKKLEVMVHKRSEDEVDDFALNDSDGDSLGNFIFSDYFGMICRQMIQSALDSLREFKYYLEDSLTPNDIVKWINTNADLKSPDVYDLEELFTDNAGVTLRAGKELTIQGATFLVQANDSFDGIAGNSLFAGGFDGAALAAHNADTKNTLTAGTRIDYPGKGSWTTRPGQSLKDVAKNIGVDVADLIKNGGIATLTNLPLPVATYQVPPFNYRTVAGDTLRGIAAKFRIDQTELAAATANGKVTGLFDNSANATLDIANLNQFKIGELIKEIQATRGLQHLSGMTSRYYMAGLRLPTAGITPEKKGMWVTGDKPADYKLPEFAGLYALTGQQFAIPDLNGSDDFIVNFKNGGLKWLNFTGSDPTKLQISIKPNTDDTKQIDLVKGFATTKPLDTGLGFLGLRGMFNTKAATYTFSTEIQWNAASAFTMPYGGDVPGVPCMQLWRLPDPLLALPDLSTRKINPRVALKVGEYNEAARAMIPHALNYYGYASVIEFTVKKVPAIHGSPTSSATYEIMGANGKSANLLERIVSEIGSTDAAVQTLILAYLSDPNSTTASGVQTDAAADITMGLAQVNLSTETRPGLGLDFSESLSTGGGGGKGMTLLNKKTDFLRLLWEASITRAGGYFLYYFNKNSAGGLPERVFNDRHEAVLSLVVVYSKPDDSTLQNTISGYTNAVVTASAIDRKHSVFFAEADPNKNVTVPSSDEQNLADLANDYFGNVSQVAADNDGLKLRTGLKLIATEGVYEVGPNAPGGSLKDIAEYFGTTEKELKGANPKVTVWPDPLLQYTVLYLPPLSITVGTSKGGNTLGDLAKYYGINLTALANHNRNVSGIFADGQSVKISGGPVLTASTVPPGNVTLGAIRPKPKAIPKKPTGNDYGEIFLRNMYSLLSYRISSNLYFKQSNEGLPSGPAAEPENSINVSRIRAPRAIAEGDDWLFRMAAPYDRYSLQSQNAVTDLPDPNDSPYKGLGDILQIDFAWQDLYGNRLITGLSEPAAGDTPLNKPPILTGYNDPLIGLKQWPSVATRYEVVDDQGTPKIILALTFDASVYQGLISAGVGNIPATINAVFTDDLDRTSAETISNFTLDKSITIQSAVLDTDKRTVKLKVDKIPSEAEITLSVANINNAEKRLTFQGTAKFYHPANAGEPTSTLVQKAGGDLRTYTRLWYQLKDPNGIAFTVKTGLVTDILRLETAQVSELVDGWVASIWKFVNDRAHGRISVPAPAASQSLGFTIDETKLNPRQIYKLDLKFTIERTGGAVMGELETTGGIRSVTTAVSPCTGAAGDTASGLVTFAKKFEQALSKAGDYELKIATGVDREESLAEAGGNELWVVRLGLKKHESISYRINDGDPLLFAPRPVSTKLENRDQVPIWNFNPKTGISFKPDEPDQRLDFTGIDMDLWARQFLGAVDNLLSSEFTAAIQLVDHNKTETYLQTMLDNKTALAGIIKNWMTYVFTDQSGSLSEIQEAFRQQLLVKLSNAYAVKAGVQYSATVKAGDGFASTPKLYGDITRNFQFLGVAGDGQDNSRLNVYFSAPLNKTSAEQAANYTVSGLTVSSATLDSDSDEIVTLKLSGNATLNETTLTVADSLIDVNGRKLSAPFVQTVKEYVDVSHQARGISITAAKLNLKDSHSEPLAFLVSAPQLVRDDSGAILSCIDLNTSYEGSSIEHQIEALPNIKGYLASSWLSFLRKPGALDSDLGTARIPMILRSFPASPSMLNQQGEPSNPVNGGDLGKILEWDYTIQYAQTVHYPQDELYFTVNFNVRDDAITEFRSFQDAFNDLAQFIVVYPDVEKVFRETLIGIDATTTDQTKYDAAAIALKSYNTMVGRIIESGTRGNGLIMAEYNSPRVGATAEPYVFKLKEGTGTVGSETAALVVTISGRPPKGIAEPTVQIPECTTETYPGSCHGDFCFYFKDKAGKPLKAAAGQLIGPRSIMLKGMDILARQDVETTVELTRNVDLLPDKTTASDFIYTTGPVGFTNLYHPSIRHDDDIRIANGKNTLKQHLTNLFSELLKENSQDTLSFLMTNTYTYRSNSALDEIALPVIMQPMQTVNVKEPPANENYKTLAEMINRWSKSILKWFADHQTSTLGGILYFDLTIFSNLTRQPLPLLRLNSLTLDLDFVTELSDSPMHDGPTAE